jgi:hypothetical protein
MKKDHANMRTCRCLAVSLILLMLCVSMIFRVNLPNLRGYIPIENLYFCSPRVYYSEVVFRVVGCRCLSLRLSAFA